jgi:hypothetical protein
LQGILNGYGGIRLPLDADEMTICPLLPPNTTSLTLRGVWYRQFQLVIAYNSKTLDLSLLDDGIAPTATCSSLVVIDPRGRQLPLQAPLQNLPINTTPGTLCSRYTIRCT